MMQYELQWAERIVLSAIFQINHSLLTILVKPFLRDEAAITNNTDTR